MDIVAVEDEWGMPVRTQISDEDKVMGIIKDARIICETKRTMVSTLFCVVAEGHMQIVEDRIVCGVSVWRFSEADAWRDAFERLVGKRHER
jgi:hypothetical protein